jgi:hypothetical protein
MSDTTTETVHQTLPTEATAEGAAADVQDERTTAAPRPGNDTSGQPANDTTGAPPANGVAPPAAPTDLEIARRFEAAKQADARARKASLEAKREREALAKERADLAALRKQLDDEHAALEENPLEWADRRKVNPDHVAARFLKPMTPEERRLRDIETKLETKERLEKDAAEKAAASEKEAAHKRQMIAFVSEIRPEECPHLTSLYDADEVPALVERAINLHGAAFLEEYGREPSNAELRAYLESEAKRRATRIAGRGQQAPAVTEPSNGVSGQAAPGSGLPATNGPHTLTNNHAAQAASAKSPRPETREERRARLVAQLEAEEREAATG